MILVKHKYAMPIKKRRANGTTQEYWYYRRQHPTTRKYLLVALITVPNGPGFMSDYVRAERAWHDRVKGATKAAKTISDLITDFPASANFTKLAAKTQDDYRRILDEIKIKFGTMPIAVFNDRTDTAKARVEILAWTDGIAGEGKKKTADYKTTVCALLFSWAKKRGLISEHPLLEWERHYKADRVDRIWTPEHVEAFMAKAGKEMVLAEYIALYTGQRQRDLLNLTWTNYRDGKLYMRQSKGKRQVEVPCIGRLRAMLDQLRDSGERTSTHILVSPRGRPWKKRRFSFVFKRTCEQAGIHDLTFHDLRGTAVTMLADAGCTVPEIVAITGHSLRSAEEILKRYLARTPAQAEAAMRKLEEHLRDTKVQTDCKLAVTYAAQTGSEPRK